VFEHWESIIASTNPTVNPCDGATGRNDARLGQCSGMIPELDRNGLRSMGG
jgi:hypothetical protein